MHVSRSRLLSRCARRLRLQVNLADRRPEALQYLGASFGVTAPLLGFWQRAGYLPVYLRQTPSEVSCAPSQAEAARHPWHLPSHSQELSLCLIFQQGPS